jgi:hypothetical protein
MLAYRIQTSEINLDSDVELCAIEGEPKPIFCSNEHFCFDQVQKVSSHKQFHLGHGHVKTAVDTDGEDIDETFDVCLEKTVGV